MANIRFYQGLQTHLRGFNFTIRAGLFHRPKQLQALIQSAIFPDTSSKS